MKVSHRWLQQYHKLNLEAGEVSEILTNTGLEVGAMEKFEKYPGGLEGLVIGEVLSIEKHPNADRLAITEVEVGNGVKNRIVCGAPNVAKGQKVVVALPGTILYPIEGDSFTIKSGKIRGEVSDGMICAEDEIGVGKSHEGILVLKSDAPVGKPYKDYLNLKDDYTFEIDLTPNRTDAICHFGVARDILAVHNLRNNLAKNQLKLPSVEHFKVENKDLQITVSIENEEACPRYTGVTMTGISVSESPDWLKERLEAIGLNPINNIVDLANFVMYETGQPLHVFDADHITGNKIVIRTGETGKEFVTLDETVRKLHADDLMICNEKEGMCIAGVFGGMHSGVSNETRNIFIESAYFNSSFIRKTARRHGLSTDASYRYERGTNPNALIYALKRVALLIKEEAGGSISSDIVDVNPGKVKARQVEFSLEYMRRISGTRISMEECTNILTSLGFALLSEKDDTLKLQVPMYRTDVTREIDIVEEVLRIYGFNHVEIPDRMMTSVPSREDSLRMVFRRETARLLRDMGLQEIMNNSLTAERHVPANKAVKMLNPLSNELAALRTSLLEGGLETIRYNVNRNMADLQLFEFGTCYERNEDGGFQEELKLGLWFTGSRSPESWREVAKPVDFFEAKSVCHSILSRFGIDIRAFKVKEVNDDRFAQCIEYQAGGMAVLRMATVNPGYTAKLDVEVPVYYAEIDSQKMENMWKSERKFSPLPKFPSMRRDLALLINEGVSYSDIEKEVRGLGGRILQDVNLFDVYQGKGIADGQKSYAISLLFRDAAKTLTDKQVDQVVERMVARLGDVHGAKLR